MYLKAHKKKRYGLYIAHKQVLQRLKPLTTTFEIIHYKTHFSINFPFTVSKRMIINFF